MESLDAELSQNSEQDCSLWHYGTESSTSLRWHPTQTAGPLPGLELNATAHLHHIPAAATDIQIAFSAYVCTDT
eukprot:6416638-Amphidinium_carterae.1